MYDLILNFTMYFEYLKTRPSEIDQFDNLSKKNIDW